MNQHDSKSLILDGLYSGSKIGDGYWSWQHHIGFGIASVFSDVPPKQSDLGAFNVIFTPRRKPGLEK